MGIRVTQDAAETLVQPDDQPARVTEVAAEVFMGPSGGQRARISMSAVEVLVAQVLVHPRAYGQVIG